MRNTITLQEAIDLNLVKETGHTIPCIPASQLPTTVSLFIGSLDEEDVDADRPDSTAAGE